MLNLVVSGDSEWGGNLNRDLHDRIVDNTMKKVAPKSEADAYPAILDAIEAAAPAKMA